MASRKKPSLHALAASLPEEQLAVDLLRAVGYTRGLALSTMRALHKEKDPPS